MPAEYDRRRPRLPVELAARVDGSRGQTPFNRFVVETLESALGDGSPRQKDSGEPSGPDRSLRDAPSSSAPTRAPRPVDLDLKSDPQATRFDDDDEPFDPESIPGVTKGFNVRTDPLPAKYRCPVGSCELRFRSPALSCPTHHKRVVEG